MEKIQKRIANLKVAGKLKVYRMTVLVMTLFLVLVALISTLVIRSNIEKITEVWSPSLEYLQDLETMTAKYRIKQYQHLVEQVSSNSSEVENASKSLADGATEQAGVIKELNATIDTVVDLAADTAKETQSASARVKASANKANEEKEKMNELLTEMEHITEISKEIGKLAADSGKSAVNTRDLIDKTLVEIEKGNTITRTTADAFNQIIADMESFAEIAQNTMEKANSQAESLEQIGQGIEQLSGVVQGNAASSEENTAISINLAEGASRMHDRVNIFKLF